NLPDAGQIAIVDLEKAQAIAMLPTQGHRANFPMALDREAQRVLVVFRSPPRLLVLAMEGAVVADVDTCGDADDLFVDAKRRRVICQLRGRRPRCVRGRRRYLSADCPGSDRVGRADIALRPRPRPAVCRGSRQLRRARGDLGIPASSMMTRWVIVPLAVMAVITGWCRSSAAF